MAKVTYKRVQTNAEVDGIPILDGQLIYSKQGKTFMDYGAERVPINGTPDTEISESSTNPVENWAIKNYVDTQVGNLGNRMFTGQVLWQNEDPTQLMATTKTITLSSDDYDIIECYYKASNDGNDMESTKIIKGMNFNLSATGYQGAGLRRRITYNSDTSYTIGLYNGETLSDSGTGKYIIPVCLIGYKTGLFE